MTTVEFTNRVNLAESTTIKIVQKYLPAASAEDIISWRRRLDIFTPMDPLYDYDGYPKLDTDCCVQFTYWIEHDKLRTVLIQVSLYRNSNDDWEVSSGDHDIDWIDPRTGCRRPFVSLWFDEGEFFKEEQFYVEVNPFTLG